MLFVSFCLWMDVAIIIDDGVLLLTLELEGVKFRNCVKKQNEDEKEVKLVYLKYWNIARCCPKIKKTNLTSHVTKMSAP